MDSTVLEKRSYSKRACILQSQKRIVNVAKKSSSSSAEAKSNRSAKVQAKKIEVGTENSIKMQKLAQIGDLQEGPTSRASSAERKAQAAACLSPNGVIPPRTINEEEEDEIVAQLEAYQRQRLEIDPMRELDEALMDRTTASQNRKHKIIYNPGSRSSRSSPLGEKESEDASAEADNTVA
jgi:hypothetical protein